MCIFNQNKNSFEAGANSFVISPLSSRLDNGQTIMTIPSSLSGTS